jgi:hypothetical protein
MRLADVCHVTCGCRKATGRASVLRASNLALRQQRLIFKMSQFFVPRARVELTLEASCIALWLPFQENWT